MKQTPSVKLLFPIVLVFLSIGIVSLTSSLVQTTHRRTIVNQRKEELIKLQQKAQGLEHTLSLVQSPEFIEKEAREKLNLTKPGETIVLIGETIPQNTKTQLFDPQTSTWKQWFNVFF